MKRILILIILVQYCSLFTRVESVPAYPFLMELKQPDGKTIKVRLIGSENAHFYSSEDNYTLIHDSLGYFTYALIGKDGVLSSSNVRAHNINERNNDELSFLKSLPKGLIEKTVTSRDIPETRVKMLEPTSRNRKLAPTTLKSATVTTPTRYLVILANFSDLAFQKANNDFSNQLNQAGYIPPGSTGFTGSVKDYYTENSMGKFIPQFDVFGPVTLPQPEVYYGANINGRDIRPREMVLDACAATKAAFGANINFKQYDNNNDGYVDNVFIIYAGHPESSGAGANTIWPHQWSVGGSSANKVFDNAIIRTYACSAELKGATGINMDGIGTFCHEFGHVLGLPDLYDTDYAVNGQGFDPGPYSLMASGAYNNAGNTPPYLTIFERELLGWASSTELYLPTAIQNLQHIGASNMGYAFEANPVSLQDGNFTEWFYLENRQPIKWDSAIPGRGLMITHLDMSKDVLDTLWNRNKANALATHQCYDIIEADDDRRNSSLINDLFPTFAGVTIFSDTSTPSSKSWNNLNTEKPISNIVENNNLISFQFMTPSTVGQVETRNCTFIQNTGAQLNGTLVSGFPPKLGFCWSTQPNPTKANSFGYSSLSGGTFSYSLTGLQPNTTYYVRSFSENSNSTIQQYSNIKAFLTTNYPTEIEQSSINPTFMIYSKGNTIKIEGLSDGDQIAIHDISGKILESHTLSSSQFTSKPFVIGIYIVTVTTKEGRVSTKAVIH